MESIDSRSLSCKFLITRREQLISSAQRPGQVSGSNLAPGGPIVMGVLLMGVLGQLEHQVPYADAPPITQIPDFSLSSPFGLFRAIPLMISRTGFT